MNYKLLIGSVIAVGLGLGLFGSYLNNKHQNHLEHSDMKKSAHEMHQKNHLDHKSNHTEKQVKKMAVSDSFRATLDKTIMAYFDLQKALSKDDLTQAKKTSKWLRGKLNTETISDPNKSAQAIWTTEKKKLDASLLRIQSSKTLSGARQSFELVSLSIDTLITQFGGPEGQPISKYHCPMVNDNKGATWLQNSEGTKNPYYGSQMLHCGSKVKEM